MTTQNALRTLMIAMLLGTAGCASTAPATPAAPDQPSSEHHQHDTADAPAGYVEMGPHMLMTAKPQITPEENERALALAETLRQALEPYQDYEAVLAAGWKPFAEHRKPQELHVTNYQNARLARREFDPTKPSSLLYGLEDGERVLIGAMYTASPDATLAELDARVPLEAAQWHLHVNMCFPPRGARRGGRRAWRDPRFGLTGSISTEAECRAAGGRFRDNLFGWMVHVYPFEDELAEIFAPPFHHRDGSMGAMMGMPHGHH